MHRLIQNYYSARTAAGKQNAVDAVEELVELRDAGVVWDHGNPRAGLLCFACKLCQGWADCVREPIQST